MRLALVLLLIVAVAAGAWLVGSGSAGNTGASAVAPEDAEAVEPTAPAAALAAPEAVRTDPSPADAPRADAAPVRPAPASEPAEQTLSLAGPRTPESPDRELFIAAIDALGWRETSREAGLLQTWMAEEQAWVDGWAEGLETLADPTLDARRANHEAEERLDELARSVGPEAARVIAEHLPMYRIDERTGALLRLGRDGVPLPDFDD